MKAVIPVLEQCFNEGLIIPEFEGFVSINPFVKIILELLEKMNYLKI